MTFPAKANPAAPTANYILHCALAASARGLSARPNGFHFI
jgi:hypothetical protein